MWPNHWWRKLHQHSFHGTHQWGTIANQVASNSLHSIMAEARKWGNHFQTSSCHFLLVHLWWSVCDFSLMDVYHLLPGRSSLYDNHVIYDGYAYWFKHNGKSKTLSPLSPLITHRIKLRKGSKSSLFIRETRAECNTSKCKPQLALLMVKSNTNE